MKFKIGDTVKIKGTRVKGFVTGLGAVEGLLWITFDSGFVMQVFEGNLECYTDIFH